MHTNSVLLQVSHLSKKYGECWANRDVSFQVKHQSVVAVVGENGAGKSTAMNLIYGMSRPDSGKIFFEGKQVEFHSARQARRAGIGMVHQHFLLSEAHTVLDHLILETESHRGFVSAFLPISKNRIREKIIEKSAEFGFKLPWDERVSNLPVGTQQRIEILKCLLQDAKLLILDEPTAVLTSGEVEEFFQLVRRLKSAGKSIVLITHKLKEVMAISDQVTVFRKGEAVKTEDTLNTTLEALSEFMVGEKNGKESSVHARNDARLIQKKPLLEVKNLTVGKNKKFLNQITFQISESEIVGIAGVEGNGQSELISALIEPTRVRKELNLEGEIVFQGKHLEDLSTKAIRAMLISCIAQDRHREAVLLDEDLSKNYLLGFESLFSRFGVLKKRKLRESTLAALNTDHVAAVGVKSTLRSLSGGNQQKWVVARELQRKTKLLIAAHPTRGVDLMSIRLIQEKIRAEKQNGMGVLLVSSELDELIELSDRILVFYQGKILLEQNRDQFDEKKIGLAMAGHSEALK